MSLDARTRMLLRRMVSATIGISQILGASTSAVECRKKHDSLLSRNLNHLLGNSKILSKFYAIIARHEHYVVDMAPTHLKAQDLPLLFLSNSQHQYSFADRAILHQHDIDSRRNHRTCSLDFGHASIYLVGVQMDQVPAGRR